MLVEVTPLDLCTVLAEVVRTGEFATTALNALITRSFCFEDLIRGGLQDALFSVFDDLGIEGRAIDGSIPTKQQSNDYDRVQLQRILESLGLRTSDANEKPCNAPMSKSASEPSRFETT